MENKEPHILAAEIEVELKKYFNIHERCSADFLNKLIDLVSTILSRSIDIDSKEKRMFLKSLKKTQLEQVCRSWNLMVSGNKPVLIDRINQRFSYASTSKRFFIPNFKCNWFNPYKSNFDGKETLIECHHLYRKYSKNKSDSKCNPENCPLLQRTPVF